MIIGVDAGCLGIKDKRLQVGVYQVAYNLLKGLAKIDRENKYILYSFDPINKEILHELGNNMHNKVLHPKKGWMSIRLPLEFLKEKPDVFLGLSQAIPPYHPFKSIAFIHGLDFYTKYHVYRSGLNKLKKNTKYAVENSHKIITSSNFLKTSIIKNFNTQNDIQVIPLGVEEKFNPHGKKLVLDKPYLLFVGSLKPSKNIPGILKGFSYFLDNINKDYYLVICGGDFWMDKNIECIINKLGLRKSVKIQGAIENKLLPKFYRGAEFFVSPSLYEGFGLTYLEAMNCGCPVIAGNTGAEKEIINDCGILVNPRDYKKIAEAMLRMAKNPRLKKRYMKKGLIQAKKFTWYNFAKKILNIIKQYEN